MRSKTSMSALLSAALFVATLPLAAAMTPGTPAIESMSALAFSPEGILFIGDGKGGSVFAIELGEEPATPAERVAVQDIESKIGALLGTTAAEVLIHDLAVSPVSQRIYLAVSRGGGDWGSAWELPNELADANILLRLEPDGEMREVVLEDVPFVHADLPNPVAADKMHPWKKTVSLRADTITDMAFDNGTLYVAGLSNEEFASTMWKLPYPFAAGATATTLEIFHGAHGEFETHAPIRTFVPYTLEGESHLLAAYLCTPFVTFNTEEMKDGEHVRGRTLGEFGSGNYPLDMVAYEKNGQERLLIANSNLPLMVVKAADIANFEGEILEEPKTYLAGLTYEPRSGSGIQQLDLLNDKYFVALQRLPGGTLDLVSLQVRRF